MGITIKPRETDENLTRCLPPASWVLGLHMTSPVARAIRRNDGVPDPGLVPQLSKSGTTNVIHEGSHLWISVISPIQNADVT